MLVTSKELLIKAKKGGYALGAFNTSSIEITKAIVEAAENLSSPVIIETSEGEMGFLMPGVAVAEVKVLAKKAKIPIVLHLDHGRSFASIKKAIDAGYTSVHVDGSSLPFSENVKLTKRVVKYAHERGITVEGEIGHIEGSSSHHKDKNIKISKDNLTDPKEAGEFIKKTKVDILAISIGNIHGIYAEKPQLDFERIAKIKKRVPKPFSLHGGSGIPKNQIKKAISLGIAKVNVNTELRMAFTEGILHEFELHPDEVVPYKYLPGGTEAVKKVVENKIKLFGSNNKS